MGINIIKNSYRHKIKLYADQTKEEGEKRARSDFDLLCRMFSEEAHIKPKYVKYIISALIKTIKYMIDEGRVIKLPGLGDFFINHKEERKVRYTPLYKKYIYAGDRPVISFKVSKKWKEYIAKESVEQDIYVHDPIAFDFTPDYCYLGYYKDKNKALKEVEQSLGRQRRPDPIYTPEDIDRLCIEYGIEWPEYQGFKTKKERSIYYADRYHRLYYSKDKEKRDGETVNQGSEN